MSALAKVGQVPWKTWLLDTSVLSLYPSLDLGLADYKHMTPHPDFYVGSGDLNSGPHAHVASATPTESSPQPLGPSSIINTEF